MKYLAFVILLLVSPAQAQQVVLPKEVTVTLSAEQFNYIYGLLNERPYKEVADLLVVLRQQAMQQAKPPAAVSEKKD